MNKSAFSTSAYSGPLNPAIESGASYQPPRKAPQLASAIQKVAELWPGFFNEMLKHAAEAVPGGVNVGQWWEQVGGPHLAKGGDHKTFKKMMMDAGIPQNFQAKFERLAQEKYPPGHNTRRAPPASSSGWSRASGHAGLPMSDLANAGVAIGAVGLPLAYGSLAEQKEDPHTRVPEWRGRAGNYLKSAPYGAAFGHLLGGLAGIGRNGQLIGAGLGGLAGLGAGELVHRSNETGAREQGLGAARTGKDKRLLADASKTEANLIGVAARNAILPAALNYLMMPQGSAPFSVAMGLGSVGQGMAQKRRNAAAVEHYDNELAKAAAGAPTRGNFMMASDVPPFKAPRLDRAIQKDGALETKAAESGGMFRTRKDDDEEDARLKQKEGDMLSDYVTYNAGDFKRSKYAMSTEAMGELVKGLLKEADVSPAVAWNGGTGNPHRMASDIPAFRAPRLDRAIQKEGSISSAQSQLSTSQHVGAPKASAPPGPSIAQIAKPKGAHFGSGIAGAHKGSIGGTAPVGLK